MIVSMAVRMPTKAIIPKAMIKRVSIDRKRLDLTARKARLIFSIIFIALS